MQGGPYHDLLHSVLGAYTCYRPDIGYVSDHISSSSCLWQQLKLPSNKRSAFVLLLGSRHVLHRCRPDSQSRGGRGLHHLCKPAQQTLSDGVLQSRPRTGEDLPPLSLYPSLHLFFVLPPPLLLPASFSSLASPPAIFLNAVTLPSLPDLQLSSSSFRCWSILKPLRFSSRRIFLSSSVTSRETTWRLISIWLIGERSPTLISPGFVSKIPLADHIYWLLFTYRLWFASWSMWLMDNLCVIYIIKLVKLYFPGSSHSTASPSPSTWRAAFGTCSVAMVRSLCFGRLWEFFVCLRTFCCRWILSTLLSS